MANSGYVLTSKRTGVRLGKWQERILLSLVDDAQPIVFHKIAPIGRASAYRGRYKASFFNLAKLRIGLKIVGAWGVETYPYDVVVSPCGPRGGVGIELLEARDERPYDLVYAFRYFRQ